MPKDGTVHELTNRVSVSRSSTHRFSILNVNSFMLTLKENIFQWHPSILEDMFNTCEWDHYEKKVYTMMVNSSTNTNKINNHPLTSYHWTQKKDIWHRNPDPGLGQAQKCGRVKPVTENPTHDWDTVESSYIKLSLLEISDKLKFFWSPILNLELFNWIDSSSSKFWISGSNFSVHTHKWLSIYCKWPTTIDASTFVKFTRQSCVSYLYISLTCLKSNFGPVNFMIADSTAYTLSCWLSCLYPICIQLLIQHFELQFIKYMCGINSSFS